MRPKKNKADKAKKDVTRKKDKAPKIEVVSDEAEAATDEKTESLDTIVAERDEYKDRVQRSAADFSNYQKRMQREMDDLRKYAASPVALDLLCVLDNFHRALEAGAGQVDDDYLQGLVMIEQQLLDTLQKHGVQPIVALNQPFDPNIHDALLEEEDDSLPDKTVIVELEKGYMIHDRLLRPTRVKVSRRSAAESGEEDAADGEESSDEDTASKESEDR